MGIRTFAVATFELVVLSLSEYPDQFSTSFLQTIPSEYELYKRQCRKRRLSVTCCLFIVVR